MADHSSRNDRSDRLSSEYRSILAAADRASGVSSDVAYALAFLSEVVSADKTFEICGDAKLGLEAILEMLIEQLHLSVCPSIGSIVTTIHRLEEQEQEGKHEQH